MSSTITALTSGGGLAMAGDTSGQLELKTNNGTTAVTVTTAQDVGIGTTSPTARLTVSGIGTGSAIDYTNTTASTGRSYRWVSQNGGKFAAEDLTAVGAPERFSVSSTGDFAFNSGYGSSSTVYGCRAWVRFTCSTGAIIGSSGGVSSVTRIASGRFTVNFSFSFPDANYSGVSGFSRISVYDEFVNLGFSRGTTSDGIETFVNGSNADLTTVALAYFR